VLEPVEVAARDARQACLRDPGEELRPVEELEAVHARRELRIAREPSSQPAGVRSRLVVELMRRDERGAGVHGRPDCLVDAVVDGDEATEPQRQRVRRQARVGIVVGELEARLVINLVAIVAAALVTLAVQRSISARL
jgi:hypothetical protein